MLIFFNLVGVAIIGGSVLIVAGLHAIGLAPKGTEIYFTTLLILAFDVAYRRHQLKESMAEHAMRGGKPPSKILAWLAPRSGGHLMFIPAWTIAAFFLVIRIAADIAPKH